LSISGLSNSSHERSSTQGTQVSRIRLLHFASVINLTRPFHVECSQALLPFPHPIYLSPCPSRMFSKPLYYSITPFSIIRTAHIPYTHVLAVTSSKSSANDHVFMFPVHNIIIAAQCSALPRLPPSSGPSSGTLHVPVLSSYTSSSSFDPLYYRPPLALCPIKGLIPQPCTNSNQLLGFFFVQVYLASFNHASCTHIIYIQLTQSLANLATWIQCE
jgi:hypothetical protein